MTKDKIKVLKVQNRTIDWLLAGATTFVVGAIIALILGQNAPHSLGIGLATAATSLGSAAILNGRITTRMAVLEQHIADSDRAWALKQELPELKSQSASLVARNDELQRRLEQQQQEIASAQEKSGITKGQLAQLQTQADELKTAITALLSQKQDLERRLAALNRNYPDLSALEGLQQRIHECQLEKTTLEAQITALGNRLNAMEDRRQSLQQLEANIAIRQAELDQLNSRIQFGSGLAGEVMENEAKLQYLQAQCQQLLTERQNLEGLINQLRIEQQQLSRSLEEQTAQYTSLVQKQPEVEAIERQIFHLRLEKKELELEKERLEHSVSTEQPYFKDPLQTLKMPWWSETEIPNTFSGTNSNEEEFLKGFHSYVQKSGFYFPARTIAAFHTSLKVQGISALVILSGISGTGKSELPQLYAKYMGAQFLMLAVQPRWDSPQDLLGFYNYMENQFKATPLTRAIYQYNHSPKWQDRIALVLLDEMNLARVEYYFSEFLSKLESRRHHDAYLDIDLGNLTLPEGERRLKIPPQFLFVGTMNEDETTQTLSDKVLDRANVITMSRPLKLYLGNQGNAPELGGGGLSYHQFKSWCKLPNPSNPLVRELERLLTQTNQIMEDMGHPFAHRVYQSVVNYIVNYPGVGDNLTAAALAALADSFAQKILPKLRGIIIEDERTMDNLDRLGSIVSGLGDSALTAAFAKARQGYQFQWRGISYDV
ncbi:MAG: hypothetical protein Fur0025_10410 [Oscillatoriaceae cyanobacterium]